MTAPDPDPTAPPATVAVELPGPPHTVGPAALAAALAVDVDAGLTRDEAATRLERYGRNEIAEPPRRSRLSLFVAQFKSLLIAILVVAAGLAAAVGDLKDAVVIGVVLVLNASLGYLQEAKAERAVDALRRMLTTRARVRRSGRLEDVDGAELVPGDVVLLEAGDRVPADGRLLGATTLAVDESSLTGESTAVDKQVEAGDLTAGAPIADRYTMVWMNATVVRGRGVLLVTATGMDTEIGSVARMLSEAETRPTPLQRQIDALGRRLALVAGLAVTVVFGVALLQGDTFARAALDAIALAVAAIPEGLPAVVTLTLAVGTAGMARRNAIVKRLPSVETLGATDTICTDKTGTLTRNEMTVRAFWHAGRRHDVTGDGYHAGGAVRPAPGRLGAAPAAMTLCNDADVVDGVLVGDPTEGALLVLAAKLGADVRQLRRRPRRDELPFDAATKLMATAHDGLAGGTDLYVKGAPDVVLRRCASVVVPDGVAPLDEMWQARIDRAIHELAADGLRTLAVASRHLGAPPDQVGPVDGLVEELTFEALVGIVDPSRPGAAEAIAIAHRAGVRVKMITGDHPTTAASIARELGITGETLTGGDIDALDDDELVARIDDVGVCARVSPHHKVRIVDALRRRGRITAMTGDGVNDAAALERADIGIAMGITGTEVTKEAADLVLADDDFTTIVAAIERGRTIYDNIVSFVRFQLATNIGAILTILGARLLGLPTPFTPIQILWVNLIMDGPPAMALGVDPARPDTMTRPPRPASAQILDRDRFLRLALSGGVMAVGTLALFRWGTVVRPDDGGAFAVTLAFTTFVLFQFFNAVNARVETTTVFSGHTLRNGKLWAALAGVFVLQVAAVHLTPLQTVVDTVPLGLDHWLIAGATASSILVVEEGRKYLAQRGRTRRRRTRR
ncbi:cation-translocating P-type ATPase [Egicoccus sp. AB-alg6-2]|uniref:cation-translocating P-type ATPase n=1 Tax=Egicoccus sp. AB-alg6-2 TaxID=3242692 RepID=UPI00359E927E